MSISLLHVAQGLGGGEMSQNSALFYPEVGKLYILASGCKLFRYLPACTSCVVLSVDVVFTPKHGKIVQFLADGRLLRSYCNEKFPWSADWDSLE